MVTASIEYERPWLYPKQLEAIYDPARYCLIEASTKSGKTVGCLAWITELAWLGQRGENYWWVAPSYGQAKIAYRRLKSGLTQGTFNTNESELTIALLSGAVIWFKTAEKPDLLYGEDVYGCVIDEASRIREDAWFAIRSTITATKAPVRFIGNVKGRKNFFYKMARRAESGEPNMAYHKLTAHDAIDAGVLDAAEVADAERQLPKNIFDELYMAIPSDDGGNPFGIAAIQACIGESKGMPEVWGWDLAKSVDWTVGIALDESGGVCRFVRFQAPWNETTRRIQTATESTSALVDSTGVGDPILEMLQREGVNYEGYKFSAASKQQLMEGLAVAIQQGQIKFPDGPIVNELESYEYVYSRTGVHYSAPEGMHDDCVCALALAVMHRSHAPSLPFGWIKLDS
jgi:hypothetical protein